MKRCLVTGGAGFIGSHIASALLKQGAAVRVLDDLSTGSAQNLEMLRAAAKDGQLSILEADVRDSRKVAEAVRDVEVVFHEAARISVAESMLHPKDCFDVNITGTLNLFEAARRAGVRRVVIASSAAVYGDSHALPLLEETPAQPLSPYASSKLTGDIHAGLYSRVFGLGVSSLRYFNVYGPRQRPETPYAAAVPIFIRSLLDKRQVTVFGDGGQTRDLIYVGDVVRANLIAAEHPGAAGQVFNVCTGRATRILDLLDAVRKLIPDSPEPIFAERRAGDIYESLGSPTKAEATLGFAAATSLTEGLKETVEWMR